MRKICLTFFFLFLLLSILECNENVDKTNDFDNLLQGILKECSNYTTSDRVKVTNEYLKKKNSMREMSSFRPDTSGSELRLNEKYTEIDIDVAGESNVWPNYKWLLMSNKTINDDKIPKIFYLDSNKENYILLDKADIEFKGSLYHLSGFSFQYQAVLPTIYVSFVTQHSLCENLAITSNSSSQTLSHNSKNTLNFSIIPIKIGSSKCFSFLEFKVYARSNHSEQIKIVPIEIRTKVNIERENKKSNSNKNIFKITENKYKIKELKKIEMKLEETYKFDIQLYNSLSKNVLVKKILISGAKLEWDVRDTCETQDCVTIINEGEKKNITFVYKPDNKGNQSGLIKVKIDDDAIVVPFNVRIHDDQISLTQESINFGIITSKRHSHKVNLRIRNNETKEYKLVDLIVFNFQKTEDIVIEFEEISSMIPQNTKSWEIGKLIATPLNTNKPIYNEGKIYLILQEIPKPESRDSGEKKPVPMIKIAVNYYVGFYEKAVLFNHSNFIYNLDENERRKKNKSDSELILSVRSNFTIPLVFQNHILRNETKDNFQTVAFYQQAKVHHHNFTDILHLRLNNRNISPQTDIVFLTSFGMIFSFPLEIFNLKLTFKILRDNNMTEIRERCSKECLSTFLNFSVFSKEEKRNISFEIFNDNPTPIKLKSISWNSSHISLIYKKRMCPFKNEEIVEKKLNNLTVGLNFAPSCVYLFVATVYSPEAKRENFKIDFIGENGSEDDAIVLKGFFEAVDGSLAFTSFNVRFEPGFPGLIQVKNISAKSTFNIHARAEKVTSSDPRIIPEIINSVIPANSRSEMIRLTFDPNKHINETLLFDKNEGIFKGALTYEDLKSWKKYKQYWEKMAHTGDADIKALITVKTNLASKISFQVKGYLKHPTLTTINELNFGTIEFKNFSRRNVTLNNPSDKVVLVQFFLGPEEYSTRNLESMKLTPNVQNHCIEEDEERPIQEYVSYKDFVQKGDKKEDVIVKSQSGPELICSLKSENFRCLNISELLLIQRKNSCSNISTGNDTVLSQEVQEIKENTEAKFFQAVYEKHNLSLLQKIHNYFESFFYPMPGYCVNQDCPGFNVQDTQSFFLDDYHVGKVYKIPPHSNMSLQLLYFKPNKYSLSSMTLYIKNNLSYISTIKLKGVGGRGNLVLTEIRSLSEIDGSKFFYTIKVNDNEKKRMRFFYKKDGFRFSEIFKNPNSFNNLNYSNYHKKKIMRFFKLENIGNLPVQIDSISIEQSGCNAFGFSIKNCDRFTLNPESNHILKISYTPDFHYKRLTKSLFLFSEKQVFEYELEVEYPNFISEPEDGKFVMKHHLLIFRITFGFFVFLLSMTVKKVCVFVWESKRKSEGRWKIKDAAEDFKLNLRSNNPYFSYDGSETADDREEPLNNIGKYTLESNQANKNIINNNSDSESIDKARSSSDSDMIYNSFKLPRNDDDYNNNDRFNKNEDSSEEPKGRSRAQSFPENPEERDGSSSIATPLVREEERTMSFKEELSGQQPEDNKEARKLPDRKPSEKDKNFENKEETSKNYVERNVINKKNTRTRKKHEKKKNIIVISDDRAGEGNAPENKANLEEQNNESNREKDKLEESSEKSLPRGEFNDNKQTERISAEDKGDVAGVADKGDISRINDKGDIGRGVADKYESRAGTLGPNMDVIHKPEKHEEKPEPSLQQESSTKNKKNHHKESKKAKDKDKDKDQFLTATAHLISDAEEISLTNTETSDIGIIGGRTTRSDRKASSDKRGKKKSVDKRKAENTEEREEQEEKKQPPPQQQKNPIFSLFGSSDISGSHISSLLGGGGGSSGDSNRHQPARPGLTLFSTNRSEKTYSLFGNFSSFNFNSSKKSDFEGEKDDDDDQHFFDDDSHEFKSESDYSELSQNSSFVSKKEEYPVGGKNIFMNFEQQSYNPAPGFHGGFPQTSRDNTNIPYRTFNFSGGNNPFNLSNNDSSSQRMMGSGGMFPPTQSQSTKGFVPYGYQPNIHHPMGHSMDINKNLYPPKGSATGAFFNFENDDYEDQMLGKSNSFLPRHQFDSTGQKLPSYRTDVPIARNPPPGLTKIDKK